MEALIKDTGAQIVAEVLARHGYECYFVGGAPRDTILGKTPKDIDLATSATPDEMMVAFADDTRTHNVIPTGISHGTVTVVINHVPYEVTTFRIDQDTDGRHATVQYTRDLVEDLARRDLTTNAIAVSMTGAIIDPFGGVDDLRSRVIRFVGNAEDRLREDYLRILRWFRFYGRFSFGAEPDADAYAAIMATKDGLSQISVERVWSEVSKIIAGPDGVRVMALMRETGVSAVIGLPRGDDQNLIAARNIWDNPAFLMAAYFGKEVERIGVRWKWSNEDKKIAKWVVECPADFSIDRAKRMVYEGVPKVVASALLKMRGQDGAEIENWIVPTMPVSGSDLIERGVAEGPQMGKMLREMKERWIASDYQMSKDTLLAN